jgi:hypothetical protein
MLTHSSHSTPTPSAITASTAGDKSAAQTMPPTKTATQSKSNICNRAPRTRTKSKRLASEEAQQAIDAQEKATKQSKVASKKAVKKTHAQRIRKLKTQEVSLYGFPFPLFFYSRCPRGNTLLMCDWEFFSFFFEQFYRTRAAERQVAFF